MGIHCPVCLRDTKQKNVYDDGGPITVLRCGECGSLMQYLAAIGWHLIGYWIPKKQPPKKTLASFLRTYGLKYDEVVKLQ